ncbi:hypothetical protein JCM11641_000503 [Rhodosporidiobolus odoratus]
MVLPNIHTSLRTAKRPRIGATHLKAKRDDQEYWTPVAGTWTSYSFPSVESSTLMDSQSSPGESSVGDDNAALGSVPSTVPSATAGLFDRASSAAEPVKVFQPSTADAAASSTPAPAPASSSVFIRQPSSSFASSSSTPATSSSAEAVFTPAGGSVIRVAAPSSPAASSSSTTFSPPSPTSSASVNNANNFYGGPSRLAVMSISSSLTTYTVDTSSSGANVYTSLALVVASPAASSTTSLALVALASPSAPPMHSSASTAASQDSDLITPSSTTHLSASPASASASAPAAAQRDAGSPSAFFHSIGKSPAKIALTSFVSAAILAVLLGFLAFFIRRCHRRRKKDMLGDLLGHEGGVSPTPDWTEKYGDFQVGGLPRSPPFGQSPGVEPDEVWRRRLSAMEENAAAEGAGDAEGAAWLPNNGGDLAEPRRNSEATIGTDILYPSRAGSFAQHPSASLPFGALPNRLSSSLPPQPSHPATTSQALQANISSDSASRYPITPLSPSFAPVYQRETENPFSPNPASPVSSLSPGRREPAEAMSEPATRSASGGWRTGLDWVMGSAAGLMESTFGAKAEPGDLEKGDFAPPNRPEDRFTTFPRRQPSVKRDDGLGYGTLPRSRPAPLDLAVPSFAATNNRSSFLSIDTDSSSSAYTTPSTLTFPKKTFQPDQPLLNSSSGNFRSSLSLPSPGATSDLSSTSPRRFEPVPIEQRRLSKDPAENPFAPPRPTRSSRSIRHARRASLELPYSAGTSISMGMSRQRSSSLDLGSRGPSPFDDDESLWLSDEEEEGEFAREFARVRKENEQDLLVGDLMRERRRKSMLPHNQSEEDRKIIEETVYSDRRPSM